MISPARLSPLAFNRLRAGNPRACELALHCRGPLVLYALRELGVNPHHVEAEPRAQQIEVANREALAEWILWA